MNSRRKIREYESRLRAIEREMREREVAKKYRENTERMRFEEESEELDRRTEAEIRRLNELIEASASSERIRIESGRSTDVQLADERIADNPGTDKYGESAVEVPCGDKERNRMEVRGLFPSRGNKGGYDVDNYYNFFDETGEKK